MAEEKNEEAKKEEAKKAEPSKEVEQGGGSSFSIKFAFFMVFVSMLVFLPTTVLFAVCLIPTLVSYIVDNNERKTAWLTVGAMNVAGTVPIWFNLWNTGHTLDNAFDLIRSPMTIIVSFGGAALGWFIYVNVTPFVAGILRMKNESRLKQIEVRQQALIKKWGEEVTK